MAPDSENVNGKFEKKFCLIEKNGLLECGLNFLTSLRLDSSVRALPKRKENSPFGHSMGVARDDEETLRTERPEFEAGAQSHRDWRHASGNADGAGRGS